MSVKLGVYIFAALLLASTVIGGALAIRSHLIGVGEERCESRHKAAEDAARLAAIEQEKAAPGVAAWIAQARRETEFVGFDEPYATSATLATSATPPA